MFGKVIVLIKVVVRTKKKSHGADSSECNWPGNWGEFVFWTPPLKKKKRKIRTWISFLSSRSLLPSIFQAYLSHWICLPHQTFDMKKWIYWMAWHTFALFWEFDLYSLDLNEVLPSGSNQEGSWLKLLKKHHFCWNGSKSFKQSVILLPVLFSRLKVQHIQFVTKIIMSNLILIILA